MSRSVAIRQRIGTVAVTAIGMFAGGGGLGITPLTLMSLQVIVGGMAQRPRAVGGRVEIRDMLDLTVAIDHNVVDGAPAIRFGAKLRTSSRAQPCSHHGADLFAYTGGCAHQDHRTAGVLDAIPSDRAVDQAAHQMATAGPDHNDVAGLTRDRDERDRRGRQPGLVITAPSRPRPQDQRWICAISASVSPTGMNSARHAPEDGPRSGLQDQKAPIRAATGRTLLLAMFVGDEVLLDLSFAAARARLAHLSQGGVLFSTSQDAYGRETTGMTRVGLAGMSKLVRVQASELAGTADSAGLAIRWEAAGHGGGLLPVLDADIRLAPAGEQLTVLTLIGAYRPPLGSLGEHLDRTILHRLAAATIRNFIIRLAADIIGENGPADAVTTGAGLGLPPIPTDMS